MGQIQEASSEGKTQAQRGFGAGTAPMQRRTGARCRKGEARANTVDTLAHSSLILSQLAGVQFNVQHVTANCGCAEGEEAVPASRPRPVVSVYLAPQPFYTFCMKYQRSGPTPALCTRLISSKSRWPRALNTDIINRTETIDRAEEIISLSSYVCYPTVLTCKL